MNQTENHQQKIRYITAHVPNDKAEYKAENKHQDVISLVKTPSLITAQPQG